MMIKIISATTAMTRKIPNPMPALKIPAMASHELNTVETITSKNALRKFEFFIVEMF